VAEDNKEKKMRHGYGYKMKLSLKTTVVKHFLLPFEDL